MKGRVLVEDQVDQDAVKSPSVDRAGARHAMNLGDN